MANMLATDALSADKKAVCVKFGYKYPPPQFFDDWFGNNAE